MSRVLHPVAAIELALIQLWRSAGSSAPGSGCRTRISSALSLSNQASRLVVITRGGASRIISPARTLRWTPAARLPSSIGAGSQIISSGRPPVAGHDRRGAVVDDEPRGARPRRPRWLAATAGAAVLLSSLTRDVRSLVPQGIDQHGLIALPFRLCLVRRLRLISGLAPGPVCGGQRVSFRDPFVGFGLAPGPVVVSLRDPWNGIASGTQSLPGHWWGLPVAGLLVTSSPRTASPAGRSREGPYRQTPAKARVACLPHSTD